ncbi:MAG: serine/threonine protein kinase, partial [Pirellulales bacterium]|nr:serine/threonine protein kinase [Pirellulales bacterium]
SALLDEYLNSLEASEPFDRHAWVDRCCQQHIDLADDIREGIERIDCLHSLSSMKDGLPRIDDHILHREIGRGGMGVVYEATEVSLGRLVAIKTVPTASGEDSRSLARFMIEAQAAARLEHPHITPIYRVGSGEGVRFLSMKLIVGDSLDRKLQVESLPAGRCIDWMIQAAEALNHAHQCGVIHRDVKPSNLMVEENGHLWVNDFGLARISDDVSLTGSGDMVGTLAYMSPEQVSGDPVDRRTDVYAVGLTLFELLTGRRAIAGKNRAEVLAKLASVDAFHVRSVDASIDRDLDTIIAKATARNPSERYTTAGELAADLQRFQQSRPILAHPPSLGRQLSKWIRRQRRLVAAALIVLVLAMFGSLIATWRVVTANLATEAALEDSQRNLRRTEEILDRFGLLAAQRLRHVEGAEEVRRELLRQTLKYYQDYARQVADEPHFVEQNAITHYKAAQIIAEIGARENAASTYDRALRLFESNRQPTFLGARTHLLCLNNLAMLRAEMGQASAETLYRQTIKRQRRLLDQHGTLNSNQRRALVVDLAKSYGNLGMWRVESGQADAAIENFESGLTMVTSLADSGVEAGLAEAMLLSNLGFALRYRDDERAMEMTQRAIERLEDLRQGSWLDGMDRGVVVRSLAAGLSNRAALIMDAERAIQSANAAAADAAVQDYQQSITLLRDLARTSRHDRKLIHELAITENNFGRLLMQLENTPSAIDHFKQSAEALRHLCDADPQADHFQSSLGGVLHNLGRAQAEVGKVDVDE